MSDLATLETYQRFRALHRRSLPALRALAGRHRGETVYCIGTGPSLARTDLGALRGASVLLLNNAFTLAERIAARHAGVVVTDYHRMSELRHRLRAFVGERYCSTDRIGEANAAVEMFGPPFHFILPRHRWLAEGTRFRLRVVNDRGFSADLAAGLFLGFSVVFSAIQIAAHLGARRIVIVGIDMDYSGRAYFDPAIRDNWPVFNYEQHARAHFIEMRDQLAGRGIELLNGTVGGRVDVLPRVELGRPDRILVPA